MLLNTWPDWNLKNLNSFDLSNTSILLDIPQLDRSDIFATTKVSGKFPQNGP